MKTKITLEEDEVVKILEEHLSQKFKLISNVTLNVGKELRGHYTNEHYVTVFKGATCEVEI